MDSCESFWRINVRNSFLAARSPAIPSAIPQLYLSHRLRVRHTSLFRRPSVARIDDKSNAKATQVAEPQSQFYFRHAALRANLVAGPVAAAPFSLNL